MSGKKKSEVQSVLRNADETRKEIFDKQFKDLDIAKDNFNKIQSELSSFSTDISTEVEECDGLKSKVKKLNNQIKKLEKVIPQKAKTFESWSVEDFDDEYFKAQQLISEYGNISKKATSIEQKINKKRDELLKVKELKEQALQQQTFIDAKISSISYEDPMDYEAQIGFSQLCEDFLDDTQSYHEVVTLQKKIASQIASQNYEKAIENVALLNTKVTSIEEQLQCNLIKTKENLQTAFAIEEVLENLEYEFESELIDGKLSNGIVIKTINNDDFELNLSNIVVHDEEKIDIDFTINDTNQGCQIKAVELQKKLYEMGIPFNITDWGTAQPKGKKKIIQAGVKNIKARQ